MYGKVFPQWRIHSRDSCKIPSAISYIKRYLPKFLFYLSMDCLLCSATVCLTTQNCVSRSTCSERLTFTVKCFLHNKYLSMNCLQYSYIVLQTSNQNCALPFTCSQRLTFTVTLFFFCFCSFTFFLSLFFLLSLLLLFCTFFLCFPF